jgi:hypothetical protein
LWFLFFQLCKASKVFDLALFETNSQLTTIVCSFIHDMQIEFLFRLNSKIGLHLSQFPTENVVALKGNIGTKKRDLR